MEADLQRRVQRYGWDKAAAHYEEFWAAQLRPAQDALLRLAAVTPSDRVLEVACGTGLVTFRVAGELGPEGRLVATDISDRMIELARTEATRRGAAIEFRRMDAEALDYPADAFDVALCALGLMYCPDPYAALGEMHRVLTPGGRAVAAVWGSRKNCGWAEIFPIVDSRVKSEVCPLFFQLGNGEALADSFGSAGFHDVRSEHLDVILHYASAEEAIGAAFAGGPVALAYSRFNEATRDGAHAEYLDSIAPYKAGRGYAIPGEFVVVAGVR